MLLERVPRVLDPEEEKVPYIAGPYVGIISNV